MPVNSKNKGSNFERTIAKDFTKWWNDAGLEGKFFRTPGSGALAYREQEDVIGDLCTPKGFPFTIECKNQEGWKLEDLFSEKIECNTDKGSISGWWRQACIEAERANKEPILIMKKNFYDPMIMLKLNEASFSLGLATLDAVINLKYLIRYYSFNDVCDRVIVVRLKDWFEAISPTSIADLREDVNCHN